MPRVFQYPPAKRIFQLSLHQPIPITNIVCSRTHPDCLPSHCKLGAAGDTNSFWNLLSLKQLLKSLLIYTLRGNRLARYRITCVNNGFYFCRAAQDPSTAEICIPLLFEVVESKSLEERQRVVIGVVIVPLKSFGVMKEYVSREGVIAVNYISGSLIRV